MKFGYTNFVLEFQLWCERMTPVAMRPPTFSPVLQLAILQTANIFFLFLLCRPAISLGRWTFMLSLAVILGALYFANRHFAAGRTSARAHASFRSRVPSVREFPRVYGYLGLTVVQVLLTTVLLISRTRG